MSGKAIVELIESGMCYGVGRQLRAFGGTPKNSGAAPRLLSSYQTATAPHFADRGRNVLGAAMQCEGSMDEGACTRNVMTRTAAAAPRNANGPTLADQDDERGSPRLQQPNRLPTPYTPINIIFSNVSNC